MGANHASPERNLRDSTRWSVQACRRTPDLLRPFEFGRRGLQTTIGERGVVGLVACRGNPGTVCLRRSGGRGELVVLALLLHVEPTATATTRSRSTRNPIAGGRVGGLAACTAAPVKLAVVRSLSLCLTRSFPIFR